MCSLNIVIIIIIIIIINYYYYDDVDDDVNSNSSETYLKKLISVLCYRGCKQHLDIVVGNAIEQHFLNILAGL